MLSCFVHAHEGKMAIFLIVACLAYLSFPFGIPIFPCHSLLGTPILPFLESLSSCSFLGSLSVPSFTLFVTHVFPYPSLFGIPKDPYFRASIRPFGGTYSSGNQHGTLFGMISDRFSDNNGFPLGSIRNPFVIPTVGLRRACTLQVGNHIPIILGATFGI